MPLSTGLCKLVWRIHTIVVAHHTIVVALVAQTVSHVRIERQIVQSSGIRSSVLPAGPEPIHVLQVYLIDLAQSYYMTGIMVEEDRQERMWHQMIDMVKATQNYLKSRGWEGAANPRLIEVSPHGSQHPQLV